MCVCVFFLTNAALSFLYQPVFDEQGQVVGIASSHLRGAGNIGYISELFASSFVLTNHSYRLLL